MAARCARPRVASFHEQLELFAAGLTLGDVVAPEATSGAGLIPELIEPHVVAVWSPPASMDRGSLWASAGVAGSAVGVPK